MNFGIVKNVVVDTAANGARGVVALVAAGVLAMPMVAGASVKANQESPDTVVITYQVEDTQTAAGLASIERKIRGAANLVCGTVDYGEVRSLKAVAESRSCYEGAVSQALSELGSGTLRVTSL